MAACPLVDRAGVAEALVAEATQQGEMHASPFRVTVRSHRFEERSSNG
jgi:hypothetical protein